MRQLLIIDGKDRSYGISSSFNYNLENYATPKIEKFRINKITIPYSFYGIRSQEFSINVNNAPAQYIQFVGGNYSANELAIYLQGLINAVSAQPIVITYNQATNKFSFNMTPPHVIDLTFPFLPLNYNLGFSLGLVQTNTNTGNFTSLTAARQANLSATSNLYLSSSTMRSYNTSYFNKKAASIIQTIPVNVSPFNYIIFQNSIEVVFKGGGFQASNIDFQIYDDDGNLIELNNEDIIIEIELFLLTEI